jgi:hypothetical protein
MPESNAYNMVCENALTVLKNEEAILPIKLLENENIVCKKLVMLQIPVYLYLEKKYGVTRKLPILILIVSN